MDNFFLIEPEVAGGLSENSLIDRSSGRMVVTRLHYKFDGWLGDHILESTPCYIATKTLASALEGASLSGFRCAVLETSTTDEFVETNPDTLLPSFVWLQITGHAGVDDFGIAPGLRLVVSKSALEVLKSVGMTNAASIEPWVA